MNGIINITDGNGGYSIVKKNNDISVNLSGTRITVYSTVIGSHTLQVRDSVGKVVSLSVKILSPLVVNGFNQSIQKYVGESISYTVNSGNGGYSVNSSNTNVASVSANYGGTNGVITAKGVGNATITLKDGSGKSVSIYLYVNAKVNIIDTQYTPTVEEGYVGGIYFKVDNPSGVKEAGVQYYNNTINSTPSSSSWKTQTIPNQGDGEFAGFILPKTKYTNVRGYVITTGGETIYTSAYTITYGGSSLYAYYNGGGTSIANVEENGDYSDESSEENIGENSESEYSEGETNEEGVEVNSIGAFIGVGIFVAGVGLTAYTCEQDGWTSSSCLVGGALTFIPVGKIAGFAGKFIPKQAVVNYFSSTALGRLSTTLGKYVDDVARLGVNGKLLVNILNNITNISTKISNGHAFSKHISEFKSLGITTNEQLKSHIEKVIKNATNTNLKVGSNSRVAFCDNKTSTIVIYDKNSVDLGTVFIPTEGKTYFNNFK